MRNVKEQEFLRFKGNFHPAIGLVSLETNRESSRLKKKVKGELKDTTIRLYFMHKIVLTVLSRNQLKYVCK